MENYKIYFPKHYELYYDMPGEIGLWIGEPTIGGMVLNEKLYALFKETTEFYEKYKDAPASKEVCLDCVNKLSNILYKLDTDNTLCGAPWFNEIRYYVYNAIRVLTSDEVRVPAYNVAGISYNGLVRWTEKAIETFKKEYAVAGNNFHKVYSAYLKFYASAKTYFRLTADDGIHPEFFPDTKPLADYSINVFYAVLTGYELVKSGDMRQIISKQVERGVDQIIPWQCKEANREYVMKAFRKNSLRVLKGENGRGVI